MPDMVVSTAFRAQDKVTGAFKRMGKGADKFGNQAGRAFDRAGKRAGVFGGVVKGILTAGIIRRGFGLLQQGIRGVTEEFISFDDAITAAAAKFGGIERGTRAFEELKRTARDVGAVTEFTATQAAEGLRFLAKAGWDAVAAQKALPSFVDLATASEMEFSRAADIATDVMGAFGLKSEDVTQNLENLIRVNDVLSKAVNMANIDMEDLFETIKDAGPIAKVAGLSIEKFTAIAAFIGGAGIKGSKGGTALKTAILALTAKTPKATKLFKDLGIKLEDVNKNLRDPIVLFDELRVKMKDMGTAQKAAALSILFGKRAIAGAAVSIEGGSAALGKFENALIDAGGTSSKMAALMRQSIGKRLKALESAAIELGFKVIDTFAEKIPGGIDGATEAIRKFDVKPVIQDIKDIAGTMKNLAGFVKDIEPLIWGVTAAWIAHGIALKGMAIMSAVQGFIALTVALKGAAAGTTLLSAAFAANPIGVIVLAIGLLVTAIVLVVQNWETLEKVALAVFDAVADAVKSFGFWFTDFMEDAITINWSKISEDFGPIVKFLGDKIQQVWDWFSGLLDNPFIAAIATIFLPMITIPALIIKHWEPVKEFFIKLYDKLSGVWDFVSDIGSKIGGFLGKGVLGLVGVGAGAAEAGGGTEETPAPPPIIPPNQTETEARQQQIGFQGLLQVAGAPEGSTLETRTTGAPPIETELLGPNP